MSEVKFINKNNLRIARENMGLDAASASGMISKSKKNLIEEWENGESLPTWSQVAKLSKLYNILELLFFSKETIQKNKTIPDYRTSRDEIGKNDKGVKKLINLVITRQKWLEVTLREQGSAKNKLQGSGKSIQYPSKLADFIAEQLNISIEEIKNVSGAGSRKKVLDYLIQKAENQGVFVGKTISYHRLEVDDMRGLFISNDYCPFIIINRSDALSAQIFSFVHEMAHLFRKSDAISNSLAFRKTNENEDLEELFCNKVAAELLLPEEDFAEEFYTKSEIDSFSELYKVSKIFVFYRLKDLGKIQKAIQYNLEKEILAETAKNVAEAKARRKKNRGGNYTNSMRDSNGNLFNRVISRLYIENKIGYVEAAKLLRFSVEKT